MKNTLLPLIIALFTWTGTLTAQIPLDVVTNVIPPYPKQYSFWASNANSFTVTVSNFSDQSFDFYVAVTIESTDGSTYIRLNETYRPSTGFTIQPSTTITLGSNVIGNIYDNLGLDNLELSPNIPLDINGELPAGEYTICTQILEYNEDPAAPPVYLSPLSCSDPFEINQGSLTLEFPNDYTTVSEHFLIDFLWTNNSLTANDIENQYILKLFELDSLTARNESIYDLVETGSLAPIFTSEPQSGFNFIYDVSFGLPPLTPGYLYAAQVEVANNEDFFYENGGKSNINQFWYGFDPGAEVVIEDLISDKQEDCFLNCNYPLESTAGATSYQSIESIEVGHFTMDDIEFTTVSGDFHSGTGRIRVPWLNDVYIETEFSSIKINSEGRLIDGTINAKQAEDMPTILDQIYNGVNTARLVAGLLGSEATLDLPLGVDQSIGGTTFLIALTELRWDPTSAYVNTACNIKIPAMAEDTWFSLESTETCMHPGGFGNEFMMHMGPDLPLTGGGDITFTLLGSESDDPEDVAEDATYIQMDCNGIKAFSLKGAIDFPRSMIVPDSIDGMRGEGLVNGRFGFTIERAVDQEENVYFEMGGDEDVPFSAGIHALVKVEIDPFQLKNLEGWGFAVDDMWYDFSEVSNVPNMVVPESHTDLFQGSLGNNWTGFYMKQGRIMCPKEFLGDGGRAEAQFNHGMIDPKISVNISVNELFPIDEGNVDGWALSMDSLFISIAQNTITEGGFSGQLGMPITGEAQYLRYTATISPSDYDEGSSVQYIMNVSPEEDVEFPFMFANASLLENSYVEGRIQPGNQEGTYFETFLAGALSVGSDNAEDEEVLPFELSLLEFAFKYNSNDGFSDEYFALLGSNDALIDNTEDGEVSGQLDFSGFASDEGQDLKKENIAGLPIGLTGLELKPSSTPGGITFEIASNVTLCPGVNGFAMDAAIDINSTLQGSKEKKLRYESFNVPAVAVDLDVMGLKLDGELEFYNGANDLDVGQEGVRGELGVMLPLGIGMKMGAEFGAITSNPSAAYNTATNYPYWYLDGMVFFGDTGGIPFAGPVGIYGLGGGISYNMTRSSYENDVEGAVQEICLADQIAAGQDVDAQQLRRTSSPPSPRFQSYGMKMAGVIGTIPSASLINMDVSIQVEFSSAENFRLSLLNIGGSAFLLTPLGERDNPKVWADVGFTFENPSPGEFAFDGEIAASMDVFGILRGDGPNGFLGYAHMHASNFTGTTESGEAQGNWFLHIGNPDLRCGMKVGFEDLPEMSGTGYFMLGHELPTELPMPDRIAELLGAKNKKGGNKLTSGTINSSIERSTTSINNAANGTGLALGLEGALEIDISAFGVYAKLAAFIGMDINVTKNDNLICANTGNKIGINGWYGQGQIYAGLEGGLGFRVKMLGKEHDLELFGLQAAVLFSGGGPAPFYAEGRLGLQIRALAGLIKCQKTIGVEIGQKCIPAYGSPFGGIPIVAEVYPRDGETDVSNFERPIVKFSLPMDKITSMTLLNEEGDPYQYHVKPYIDNIIFKEKNGDIVDFEEELRYGDTELRLTPETSLLSKKRYEVTLTIKAYEYPLGKSSIPIPVIENGQEYRHDTTFTFRVGELDDLNDLVSWSTPIDGQRYFLQDELNIVPRVTFLQRHEEAFKQDDDEYSYTYYVRYLSENSNEDPIVVDIDNPLSADHLDWDLPQLDNDKHYCMQFIRKRVSNRIKYMDTELLHNMITVNIDNNQYGVSTSDTLNLGNVINPVNDLGFGEVALITHFFKTSRYNTLDEKIRSTGHSWNHSGDIVTINTNERFDKYDVKGVKDGETVVLYPLIRIFDPMELEARNVLDNLSTPYGYTDYYEEDIDGKIVKFMNRWVNKGLDVPFPLPETMIDYLDEDLENPMHRQVVNYDAPLDESVLDLFASHPMAFSLPYSFSSSISTSGVVSSADDVELYFTTFDRAYDDAWTLYDFADELYNYETYGNYIYRPLIESQYGYTRFKDNYDDLHHPAQFSAYDNRYTRHYIDIYHGRFNALPISSLRGFNKQVIKFIVD